MEKKVVATATEGTPGSVSISAEELAKLGSSIHYSDQQMSQLLTSVGLLSQGTTAAKSADRADVEEPYMPGHGDDQAFSGIEAADIKIDIPAEELAEIDNLAAADNTLLKTLSVGADNYVALRPDQLQMLSHISSAWLFRLARLSPDNLSVILSENLHNQLKDASADLPVAAYRSLCWAVINHCLNGEAYLDIDTGHFADRAGFFRLTADLLARNGLWFQFVAEKNFSPEEYKDLAVVALRQNPAALDRLLGQPGLLRRAEAFQFRNSALAASKREIASASEILQSIQLGDTTIVAPGND